MPSSVRSNSKAAGIALLAATALLTSSIASAIEIEITNNLDAADFDGASAADIAGVIARAVEWWEFWYPDDGGKAEDHPQNTSFTITFNGADLGGANPASTPQSAQAKPTGVMAKEIKINTNAAVADDAMFWDSTPATTTSAEFSNSQGSGRWKAEEGDAGFDKFDMLTVIKHEIGHAVGFSRGYTDFDDWADDDWNPIHPANEIGISHFAGNHDLMSGGAGFADGKSGRSDIQNNDLAAFAGAYGSMLQVQAQQCCVINCDQDNFAAAGVGQAATIEMSVNGLKLPAVAVLPGQSDDSMCENMHSEISNFFNATLVGNSIVVTSDLSGGFITECTAIAKNAMGDAALRPFLASTIVDDNWFLLDFDPDDPPTTADEEDTPANAETTAAGGTVKVRIAKKPTTTTCTITAGTADGIVAIDVESCLDAAGVNAAELGAAVVVTGTTAIFVSETDARLDVEFKSSRKIAVPLLTPLGWVVLVGCLGWVGLRRNRRGGG